MTARAAGRHGHPGDRQARPEVERRTTADRVLVASGLIAVP
jgi:hypothetical protein